MIRTSYVLIMYLILQSAADRDISEATHATTSNISSRKFKEPGDEAQLDEEIKQLKLAIGEEGTICGNQELHHILKGSPNGGESDEQIYVAIREIPWDKVKNISDSFMETSRNEVERLLLEANVSARDLKKQKEFEEFEKIDASSVLDILIKAIEKGYHHDVYLDPLALARLTHCGGQRPSNAKVAWGDLPIAKGKKIGSGSLYHPRKADAAKDTVATFSAEIEPLYAHSDKRLYIDRESFHKSCCETFNLPDQCISKTTALNEKCDDICRESDTFIGNENIKKGFEVASNAKSANEIQQTLEEIWQKVKKLNEEIDYCDRNYEEIATFREAIEEFQREIQETKNAVDGCRDSLWDAEDEVAHTKDKLDESQEKLNELSDWLSRGDERKQNLNQYLKKATAEVDELRKILEETKISLEETQKEVEALSAANTVIMGLREKVSQLLLQMALTFENVVAKRIQDHGFEDKNAADIVTQFPNNVHEATEDDKRAFTALDTSIDDMVLFCADDENMAQLRAVEGGGHTEIPQFCTGVKDYDQKTISDQFKAQLQGYIDQYKEWMGKTAEEYQKFHAWAVPVETPEEDPFEPLGFARALRAFENTKFWQDYLSRWKRENGSFFVAYNQMLAKFAEKAEHNDKLLTKVTQSEIEFGHKAENLEKIINAIQKLSEKMSEVEADRTKERELFNAFTAKLNQFEELVKEKTKIMEEAEAKYMKSMKILIGFHQKKTSLVQMFKDMLGKLVTHAEHIGTEMKAKKEAQAKKRHMAIAKHNKDNMVVEMNGVNGAAINQHAQ